MSTSWIELFTETPSQRFHQRLNYLEQALELSLRQVHELKTWNYDNLPPLEAIDEIEKAFPKDFGMAVTQLATVAGWFTGV